MSNLLGGGARKEARRQQEIAREQQQVANNRQMAELNRAGDRAVLARRNPRGRRLFADSGSSSLPNTLA